MNYWMIFLKNVNLATGGALVLAGSIKPIALRESVWFTQLLAVRIYTAPSLGKYTNLPKCGSISSNFKVWRTHFEFLKSFNWSHDQMMWKKGAKIWICFSILYVYNYFQNWRIWKFPPFWHIIHNFSWIFSKCKNQSTSLWNSRTLKKILL